VLVDLTKPFMQPEHSLVANLVYSASSGCVDTVIVKGEIVVENGKFVREDEHKILEKAGRVAEKLKGSEEQSS